MADGFMENRAAPIEPINFGIQDALAQAYQYLLEKERMLKAPGRALAGGLATGGGLVADRFGNLAASIMGAQRPDPDAATNAALQYARPAMQDLSSGAQSVGEAMNTAKEQADYELDDYRKRLLDSLGWKNAQAQPAPELATPAPVMPRAAAPAERPAVGAIPPAPRRIVAPRTPGGALPIAPQTEPVMPSETPGDGDIYASQAGANALPQEQANPTPSAPAAQPAAPQKGLREQYLERIAGMAKQQPAGMTDEQKGQALMEAGLAIMASASKHGASALGAVGEGGMKGTAVAREMERINRERSDKARAEDRASVAEEFKLAGEDARLALEKQRRDEDRAARIADLGERSADRKERNANAAKHIAMLERQLEEGRTKVVEDGATGTYSILNVVTGEKKPTGVKVNHKDDTPAELRVLKALQADPSLLETYQKVKGEKGGISDKDIIAQAVELTKGQTAPGGTENPEAILQRNIDAVKRAAGRQGVAPSREAQAQAIKEQFRQKQITKEQAIQQLQKLGYQ